MRTATRLSWKTLVSRLHPPMPMSPKESANLLKLLNTSFQQQLDHQHPTGLPGSEQSTEVHLRSVLNNPLFNRERNPRSRNGTRQTFGRVEELVKRPMDVFKEKVANGSATLQTATFCLQSHYNNCLASPDIDVAAAMKSTKAGSVVADWLWSSGLEESGEFFNHHDFLGLFIRFLVAELDHDRIWRYLRKLDSKGQTKPSLANLLNFKHIFDHYIKSEVTIGNGLESGAALFVRTLLNLRQDVLEDEQLFLRTAYYLTWKLLDAPKTPEMWTRVINPYLEVTKTFGVHSATYLRALHDMYLSQDPNPDSALEYFQRSWSKHRSDIKPIARPRIALLGLRTAEVCLERGRQSEAIALMDILQKKFPAEIGWNAFRKGSKLERSGAEAEEQNLRLLDSLAMG